MQGTTGTTIQDVPVLGSSGPWLGEVISVGSGGRKKPDVALALVTFSELPLKTKLQIPVPSLTSSVTLDKFFNLSVP